MEDFSLAVFGEGSCAGSGPAGLQLSSGQVLIERFFFFRGSVCLRANAPAGDETGLSLVNEAGSFSVTGPGRD